MQNPAAEGRGEAVAVIRPGYRISYVRPCGEEGKKIVEAKLRLVSGLGKFTPLIEKNFQNVDRFPKMDMLRFEDGGLSILLYGNGDLVIRKVRDLNQAVKAAEKIWKIIASLSEEAGGKP